VEGEDAALLAEADNLRTKGASADRQSAFGLPADLSSQLSRHLAGITSIQPLLGDSSLPVVKRTALDLLQVHMAYAQWLVQASTLMAGRQDVADDREPLGAILNQVATTFTSEARLTGVPLRMRIDDRAYTARFSRHVLSIGLTGGVVSLLPFADSTNEPALTIGAGRSTESVTIDISVVSTGMDESVAHRFFDQTWTTRPGGWPALLGIRALETAVVRHGGTVRGEARAREARIHIEFPEQH
jgi:hypothetical protein